MARDIPFQPVAFNPITAPALLSEGQGPALAVRPGYPSNLVPRWIPALEGVEAKLHTGARVADICCGCGAATILLAEAYPNARFYGFETHEPSVEAARRAARLAGVTPRVYFQLGAATDFPGWAFDLVTCFERLHEVTNPDAAARRVRSALAPEGTWMIVEPRVHSDEERVQPAGRGSPISGASRIPFGEKAIRQIVESAGFSHFRKAAETPFNVVFEVRV